MNKPGGSKFLNLLNSFFCDYLPIGCGASRNTIKSYKYAFQLLLRYMHETKDVPPDLITFDMLTYDCISGFLHWLETERNCSASTKNQRLSALLSFSEYAQNKDFEAASSFRSGVIRIPMKKHANAQRAIFSVDEVKHLLEQPNCRSEIGYRDKVIMVLMYGSAARAQEICELRVKDITYYPDGKAVVILSGKGNKKRRVGIPQNCAEILKNYIVHCGINDKPGSYVFKSQRNEKISVSCIEELFKKYVKQAKQSYSNLYLEKSYPPHSMRHTAATHMLEAGLPLIYIKNMLGHVSIQTTQIYALISQKAADKYLKEWNKKWFETYDDHRDKESERIPDFLKV